MQGIQDFLWGGGRDVIPQGGLGYAPPQKIFVFYVVCDGF